MRRSRLLPVITLAALTCAAPAHAFKLPAFGSAGAERLTRPACEKTGVAFPGQDGPAVTAILEEQVFRLAGSVPTAQPGRRFDWRLEDSQQGDMRKVPIAALDRSCRQ
jgi:hypothetical protein